MALIKQENPASNASIPAQDTQSSSNADASWDEQRLENAMDVLQDLYIQLRGLRTTVPRLIAPLTIPQPSPETTFREFSTSTKQAKHEVQQFRKSIEAQEAKEVLDYAHKSRAERPGGIRPWVISEHPNWLEKKGAK